jgi:hypothetical protein
MSLDPRINFGKVVVSTGYDAAAVTIVLGAGYGARLPSTFSYNLVWWNFTDFPDPSEDPNVEIVRVTNRVTDTLTVIRAQEGTLASTKNTANKTYKMVLSVTKKMIDDIEASGGPSSLVVGSTVITGGTPGNILFNNSGILGDTSLSRVTSRAAAYLNTAQSLPNGVTEIQYDTLTPGFGSTSEFDITINKGRFTSILGGVYLVTARVYESIYSSTTGDDFTLIIYKNGITQYAAGNIVWATGITFQPSVNVSALIELNPGEYFDVRQYNNTASANSFTAVTGQVQTWIQIALVEPVSSGGAFTSRASAYLSGAQDFPQGETVIQFDALTPGFGSTSEFDIVTHKGRFTSTNGGVYQVNANMAEGPYAPSGTYEDTALLIISVNGTPFRAGESTYNVPGAIVYPTASVSCLVHLAPGDYIEIIVANNTISMTNFAGDASQLYTWVTIVQVQ